jgi:hypothetical protein
MNTLTVVLGLVAGTNALIAERWAPCCFHVSASGAVTGTIGQLNDGQNRQGGGLSPAQYCIADGAIKDANGRGCILTRKSLYSFIVVFIYTESAPAPTTQWQCDTGATSTSGFSIGCDGTIAYNGGTTFWECQTGDHGEANIYSTPGGSNCGQVTLKADSCFSGCPPPGCPANLNGNYEFPHLIIPIDSSNPSSAPGTSYFGQVSSTISSIFNFDIPASDAGKTCSLTFLFPLQSQLTTSSFAFSGNGGIDFSKLNGVATSATSYNNAPGTATDYGTTVVAPGHSYTIATFPCPAGTAVSFEMKAVGDTNFRYFQDYNPSPIGMFVTTC